MPSSTRYACARRRWGKTAPLAAVPELDRYFFDLNGYFIIRKAVVDEELAAINAYADANNTAQGGDFGLSGRGGGAGDDGRSAQPDGCEFAHLLPTFSHVLLYLTSDFALIIGAGKDQQQGFAGPGGCRGIGTHFSTLPPRVSVFSELLICGLLQTDENGQGSSRASTA